MRKGGKEAINHYEVLETYSGADGGPVASLIACRLETGRTHQIRVHCEAGLGLPLLGDPVYGDGKGAPRTMLHAAAITVPREGKPPIAATAPVPRDFTALGFGDG